MATTTREIMAKGPEKVNAYELIKADSYEEACEKSRFQPGDLGVVVNRLVSYSGDGAYTVVPQFELIENGENGTINVKEFARDEIDKGGNTPNQEKTNQISFSTNSINKQSKKI